MNKTLYLLIVVLIAASCAAQGRDHEVDTRLGVTQAEDSDEAAKALAEFNQKQMEEQKRNLERQVTDPAAAGG